MHEDIVVDQDRITQRQKHDFWAVVTKRFPRIACMVLSDSTPRRAGTPLPENVRSIVQKCPSETGAFVSVVIRDAVRSNRATRYRAF